MFPSIEPSEVGSSGLLWLFLSYGFILFKASGLISEGSELLLLVPSLAGLVGGVVLPLLGAVPDGAIMLFSGLGDISKVQETISVGVGALAGSTIMLLTIPFGLSIIAGRVDIIPNKDGKLQGNYGSKTKLSEGQSFADSGVAVADEIKHAAKIMAITTVPYFLIQVPAFFIHGTEEEIASEESIYALVAFVVCIIGFVWYLGIHVKASREDQEKFHRVEKIKDYLLKGKLSLSGAMYSVVEHFDSTPSMTSISGYDSIEVDEPSDKTLEYLRSVLRIPFRKYDMDQSNGLHKPELGIFLRDFNENLTPSELDTMFAKYDNDNSGVISFEEFVQACHSLIIASSKNNDNFVENNEVEVGVANSVFNTEEGGEEDEEEEIPQDLLHLSPEKQQSAIKKKAFTMLGVGTCMVLIFSDPMVEVMQEIAERTNISPFYVSFALAPLAANASEVLASQYYASKKTRKTIIVSFSALLGAAAMNNTFCLSIFMGIIYFRGLAWEFTAETMAIISCQVFIYFMLKDNILTAQRGLLILSFFPFSIALVAFLESLGFD